MNIYPRQLLTQLFHEKLQEKGPASTFVRLLTSRHVKDLQVISLITIASYIVAVLAIMVHGKVSSQLGFGAFTLIVKNPSLIEKLPDRILGKLLYEHAMLGAVTAAAGVVLNWAYQTGSRRLGVIDLYACEISAICRVLLVIDFAKKSIEQVDRHGDDSPSSQIIKSPIENKSRFTSEEHYTPVYDGTLSDLCPLEVEVITSITEFYTYRKSMVDYLRSLSEEMDPDRRAHLLVMMIFMQFLMYESGRHSISQLVEFEPNREESLINILCSELVAFKFLRDSSDFIDKRSASGLDFRGERLKLREAAYRDDIVPSTYRKARESRGRNLWQRAYTTAEELDRRYCEVFGKPLGQPR